MSDDEDVAPVVKKQRIHFGSLEAVERDRLAAGASKDEDDDEKEDEQEGEENAVSAAVLAGIRAGNINVSDGELLAITFEIIGRFFWSSILIRMCGLSLPKLENTLPFVFIFKAFSTRTVHKSINYFIPVLRLESFTCFNYKICV